MLEARDWELGFIEFMKNYTGEGGRMPKYFKIAFNSERSIEDELKRESEGEVSTIIVSYGIMFLYIAVALGEVGEVGRLLVSTLSHVPFEASQRATN